MIRPLAALPGLVLLLAGWPLPATAHGHVSVGFSVGGPFYRPGFGAYYPYAGYYAAPYANAFPVYQPPPVYLAAPITYLPPAPPAPAPAPAAPVTRYYCAAEKRFYPEVETCPTGWRQLPAEPADFRR